MDISAFALRLILLFFPGIVCFFVFESLTTPKERKPHQVFLLSLVFGVLSYLAFIPIDAAWDILSNIETVNDRLTFGKPNGISFIRSLIDQKIQPNPSEIGVVSALAVGVGLLLSAAANHKWLNDLARFLKITHRFGDPNVWSLALNSGQVQWATVRDIEKQFMFMGYVVAFSDAEDPAEILLTDVTVYNEVTGKELYKADRLYLSRRRDNLTVEFPNPPQPS